MLSKSVLPLPDKFHGLKDTEKRYRQVCQTAQYCSQHARKAFLVVDTIVAELPKNRNRSPSLSSCRQYRPVSRQKPRTARSLGGILILPEY